MSHDEIDGELFYGAQQTQDCGGASDQPVLQPCLTANLQGLVGNLLFACKKEMGIEFRKIYQLCPSLSVFIPLNIYSSHKE